MKKEGSSAGPKRIAEVKYNNWSGERAGTRTQDLLIKSQLLYHLSYALGSLVI
jgi:hypothetical protein